MSETLRHIFRNTAPLVSFCTMAVMSAMPIDAFADVDIKGEYSRNRIQQLWRVPHAAFCRHSSLDDHTDC